MLVLGFESSAKGASVALCRDGELLAESNSFTGLTHSRTLLPMAEDLIKNCELKLEDIDLFAVAHGPGSFTGVRIGVSAVKGLCWALDKPSCGVSTLAAMAWNGLNAPPEALICPAMDARRSEVYNALFEIGSDGRPKRLIEDRALSLTLLAKELREKNRPVYLVGDGAKITAEAFEAEDIPFILPATPFRYQNAWGVCMEAGGKPAVNAQELIPVYLRLSQAERERQARL